MQRHGEQRGAAGRLEGRSMRASYAGKLVPQGAAPPAADQENAGQVRRPTAKAPTAATRRSTVGSAVDTGTVAGAANRNNRPAQPSRPQWNGSIAEPPGQDPLQAARATVRDSIHGFHRSHGGWASNTPNYGGPAATVAARRQAVAPAQPQPAAAAAAPQAAPQAATAAAAQADGGRRDAVQGIVAASGMGCGAALALRDAPAAPGNMWTTRSQRRQMTSGCTLQLRRQHHTDVIVRVLFVDAAATPARVRLSHARADPAHAAGFALLGEVPLAGGRAGRLAHSLRLGPDRRVQHYLRLEFSGHLLPEAQSGAHKVARLEVTGLPFDHAERVPMHPAARGSIPVLRRSAASSAGTSPPAGQPRAGAAPQHPAGRSPAAAAMAAARQVEAPGAAEGAGHEAGDGHVARRHGGRQIMAAFDALDAELEQLEAGFNTVEDHESDDGVRCLPPPLLAALEQRPLPSAPDLPRFKQPQQSSSSNAAGAAALVIPRPPATMVTLPEPAAAAEPAAAGDQVQTGPGSGSPTALLSRAEAQAALRRLAGGRAGGTSVSSSLALRNSMDAAEAAASDAPGELPLASQPAALPAPVVQSHITLPQLLAGPQASARDHQQQQEPEDVVPAVSPPPQEAIDEGDSDDEARCLPDSAAASPAAASMAAAQQPAVAQQPAPQRQQQEAAPEDEPAAVLSPMPATPHPVAAVVPAAAAVSFASERGVPSPLQPWMLDMMSGLAPGNASKGKIVFSDTGSPTLMPPPARRQWQTHAAAGGDQPQARGQQLHDDGDQGRNDVDEPSAPAPGSPASPELAVNISMKRSWRSPSPTSVPLFNFDARAAAREPKRPKTHSPDAASPPAAAPQAAAAGPPAPPPPCDEPFTSPDAPSPGEEAARKAAMAAAAAAAGRRPDWCARSSGGSLGWAAGAPGLDISGAGQSSPRTPPEAASPQVLDFSDAVDGGTTAPSPSARRTGPRGNQRLWGSADSLSSGDATAAAAAAASDEEEAAEAGSGDRHSWEPSPFTWDNIPVAAPTPGYRLVEWSPEGQAEPQPAAAPPAEQPLEQPHGEPQQQPRGDPQQQLPQQRRSTRVALDTLGESLAEQPTLPPAAAASQDHGPAAAPATSDVLPIPPDSAASPALRTLPAEAPSPPERDDFGRQLRSSSGFHAASTPPEVAFMRPLGSAARAARAGAAGVLHTSVSTTVSTAAPSSAASQRSAASSAAGSWRRQQHKSAGSSQAAASSVRSSGAASFRSFGGFSGGRPAGVVTLTPPQVSASPAVPAAGPAPGAAASAAGAAAAGTPAAGAPAAGFRIPVPPPMRAKQSRGHPLALPSVPELPPATYLAPTPVDRPPAAGQETPLELRLMHPLGRALRDTAADLLGSGGALKVLTPSPDMPRLAATSRAEFGADGPRASVIAASLQTPPDLRFMRPLGNGLRQSRLEGLALPAGGGRGAAATERASAPVAAAHSPVWRPSPNAASGAADWQRGGRHHVSDPGAVTAAADPVVRPLGHGMRRSFNSGGAFASAAVLSLDDVTPPQKTQVLRVWKGVRTQKRLSVAALRSPTDVLYTTPGVAGSRLRSTMRCSSGAWAGTPVSSLRRSLRKSGGAHGSRTSLQSGGRRSSTPSVAAAAAAEVTPLVGGLQAGLLQACQQQQWQQHSVGQPRQQGVYPANEPPTPDLAALRGPERQQQQQQKLPPPPQDLPKASFDPAEGSWFAEAAPAALAEAAVQPARYLAPPGGATGIFAPLCGEGALGRFEQPQESGGIDSAADLERFGSPAIPGGGLGAGMSRLRDLDELFAQSPARRLCPEHATYDDAAEQQRGGSPSAATGRRPSADKPPVPLPTARKLAAMPDALPAQMPAVSPDSIGKALDKAARATREATPPSPPPRLPAERAAMLATVLRMGGQLDAMFPPVAVAPRDSSDWQHGAATQPTSHQQPTSYQPRRSWGSSGPQQEQQQEHISMSGTRSSGKRRLWRRLSSPAKARIDPQVPLREQTPHEVSPITTLMYTHPTQTGSSASGGSKRSWRRFLMGRT